MFARRLEARCLTPRATIAAAAVLLIADTGLEKIRASVLAAGLLDETAHLMTTLLLLWAVGGRAVFVRYLWPALVASVVIDADHIPAHLGDTWLTAGTPRPYSHSLLTVVVIAVLACLWSRRRDVLVGLGLGLIIHFWRDLSEPGTGVALFWPVSSRSWSFPHAAYLTIMGVVVLVGLGRARQERRDGGGAARVGLGRRRTRRPETAGDGRTGAWS